MFLELWPIASGNHSHVGDGKEVMQESSHLGIQRRMLSASVPPRSKQVNFFRELAIVIITFFVVSELLQPY